MDPNVFVKPKEFNPSRWDDLDKPASFLPFGIGPRMCPGANLVRLEVSVFLHYYILYYRSSEEIEADKILEELFESFIGILKQREYKVKAGQSDNFGGDFLGSLLEGHHNADKEVRISVDEIIEERKSFYFAGHKTVTSLLSWSMYLLAVHTDWQEKQERKFLNSLAKKIQPQKPFQG
ncbi:hypothetical protein K7X08_005249 [Anisodus acutangulus]|uniref:Cytochrome P450 n=1 Tax=Anisodus acutangulus TaxID=402998 RepID=A0A9Q1QV54_9SOLA|nr:hypothetical protein K7X08_005249 [Anisodus acutangulus]